MSKKVANVKIKVLPKGEDLDFYKPEFTQGEGYSVCMDLKARLEPPFKGARVEDARLFPGQILAVPTGVFLELPEGYEAEVRPRSGLAQKFGIAVVNSPGTIDTSYRGEIIVILTCLKHVTLMEHSSYPAKKDHSFYSVQDGQRIAQLAIREIPKIKVEFVSELSESSRGDKGFGSTGV